MKNGALIAVLSMAFSTFLHESSCLGQYTDLSVTGTATVGVLQVTGTVQGGLTVSGTTDFLGNWLYFGSWSNNTVIPGLSMTYNDGLSGTNASITMEATRSTATFNWARNGSNIMQLDGANRLILNGTASANPPQLILDPNGAVTLNGSSFLTQSAANALYFPVNAGLSASGGNVGIGTTSPLATLDVAGNMRVGATTGSSAAQVQIKSTSAGAIGQTIIGASSQSASLQEWQNSAGSALASIKIGNGGTPPYDYGKLSLASEKGIKYEGSIYVSEDTADTTRTALYITPPGNGRVFIGDASHQGFAIEASLMRYLNTPASVTLAIRDMSYATNYGSSLHPGWKMSLLRGGPDAAGLILHPGTWTNNIMGDMGSTGMNSLPFLVDVKDGRGYQRGAGYIFGNIQNYTTYTSPHTLWWADEATGSKLMALQMTGELDLNIQKASANGLVVKSAPSQTGDLTQWQSTSGTTLSVINKNGWVGIGSATPQAALDVNGNARFSGSLTLSGSASLILPDGTVLSSNNTLKSAISNGTASTISGAISLNQVTGLSGLIPTNNSQLTNGAGYITASGTAAYASASGMAAVLSGTIQTAQISDIDPVAKGGNLDYSRIASVPQNVSALANSGTVSNIAISGTTNIAGTTKLSGQTIVTGTFDNASQTVVAAGDSQLLIPQQGDLSMGAFTAGARPQ